jgi:hypothetical protein
MLKIQERQVCHSVTLLAHGMSEMSNLTRILLDLLLTEYTYALIHLWGQQKRAFEGKNIVQTRVLFTT